MAQKRMFSLEVIDTDLFLEMPPSSQSLYFHLGMRADDDGFVSSPKRIISMVNSSADDLKILVSKGLVIGFETGIVVITDWNINNSLRKDRAKKTRYTQERSMLSLNENGSYIPCQPNDNQITPTCQPGDNQMSAQISIDKISLEEVSTGYLQTNSQEEQIKKVVSCYESNVGNLVNPIILEEFLLFMKDGMEVEVICEAIKEAVLKENRNMKYIKGILINWLNANCLTLNQVKAHQEQFKQLNLQKRNGGDVSNGDNEESSINRDPLGFD
ncbi:DnaD domain protein [Zhenhengia yiwuensis]|uniref:DnaD domain-containing protein n=1 Tax=Zhenhengia yiwuensis TaxID=2763666 RepID=UPI002A7560DF|nr:DnaD domain protein [Zhenhengia yiwuensis]MDY3366487.1 DnaD domain protein [Zhenhengia yiwuensis]